MGHTDVTAVKEDPRRLLDFLKEHRYGVYHRSNIFFRDFQYGLWRYLNGNQTKVPYAAMEKIAKEVIDAWEERGTIRRINRQSFELNMPEYITVWPTAGDETPAADPSGEEPAPSSAPVVTEAGAVEKAAKIAELQAKMAAARAKRESQ